MIPAATDIWLATEALKRRNTALLAAEAMEFRAIGIARMAEIRAFTVEAVPLAITDEGAPMSTSMLAGYLLGLETAGVRFAARGAV